MKLLSFLFIFSFVTLPALAEDLNLLSIPTISSPGKKVEKIFDNSTRTAAELYDEALYGLNIESQLKEDEINLDTRDYISDDSQTVILSAPAKTKTPVISTEYKEIAGEQESVKFVVQESQAREPIVDEKRFVSEKAKALTYDSSTKSFLDISQLIGGGDLELAMKKSEELISWLEQAIEAHFTLYKVFKNNKEKEASQEEKNLALSFAKLRDQTLYLMADIHVKNENFKDAIKPLVKIIQSQPDSEIAENAYKKLSEIGFTY